MSIYADTSLFVSLYVPDRHTTECEKRLASKPVLWITPLHVAEWTHAIELHVFRRSASRREADRSHWLFRKHCQQGYWRLTSLPEGAFELCAQLAEKHAAQMGMRTLDSLHVACALELKAERFWTFDQRQAELAVAAGLKVK